MARIPFPSQHEKQEENLRLFLPKNNEGRAILPWEVNKMFRASKGPFTKQWCVLAYYLKNKTETPKPTNQPLYCCHTRYRYKGNMYNLLSVVCGNVWSGQCSPVMLSFCGGREE